MTADSQAPAPASRRERTSYTEQRLVYLTRDVDERLRTAAARAKRRISHVVDGALDKDLPSRADLGLPPERMDGVGDEPER